MMLHSNPAPLGTEWHKATISLQHAQGSSPATGNRGVQEIPQTWGTPAPCTPPRSGIRAHLPRGWADGLPQLWIPGRDGGQRHLSPSSPWRPHGWLHRLWLWASVLWPVPAPINPGPHYAFTTHKQSRYTGNYQCPRPGYQLTWFPIHKHSLYIGNDFKLIAICVCHLIIPAPQLYIHGK